MINSLNKKYPFNDDLKLNLKSIIGISLGVFLFLLFFQPLTPQNTDFNNKLLILAGFGAITMVLLILFRILIPSIFPKSIVTGNWNFKKEIIINLFFLIFNSVAFVFFARYVGKIEITFHKTILIILISLTSLVVLIIINEYTFLKAQIQNLTTQEKVSEDIIAPKENIEIEFESENKSEYFQLSIEQIILIKSANNYIEVIYKQNEKVNRRLIRSTLKNTEELFSKYPSMIRCHRSCIVNKNFIQKITKGTDGLKLNLFDYPQEIHVSRQYALKVKEALKES